MQDAAARRHPGHGATVKGVSVTLRGSRRDARDALNSSHCTPDVDTVNHRRTCLLLFLLSLALLSTACGQKGDLYRPGPSTEQSHNEH